MPCPTCSRLWPWCGGDDGRIGLASGYAGGSTVSSGLALWQPQFIKSFGVANGMVGWLNALPYVFAAVAMVWWGRRSDRTGERLWHTAVPLGLSGVALALCVPFTGLVPTIGLICICVVCSSATRGPFWALTSDYLSAPSAAAGIAMVNALGTGCGFICNVLMGRIFDASHSYPLTMLPIVAFALLGTGTLLMLGKPRPVVVVQATL